MATYKVSFEFDFDKKILYVSVKGNVYSGTGTTIFREQIISFLDTLDKNYTSYSVIFDTLKLFIEDTDFFADILTEISDKLSQSNVRRVAAVFKSNEYRLKAENIAKKSGLSKEFRMLRDLKEANDWINE